jgi:hypothetical protein
MVETSPGAVDLVVNTFERTYRRALSPRAVAAIAESNRHPFARRAVLINNVVDRAHAARLAQQRVDAGEIDEFRFVDEHLAGALAQVGLAEDELQPLLHYSDAPLVAATMAGSPWMLYWDPEAHLLDSADWISPALALMRRDPRVMVANPSWEPPDESNRRPGVEREAIATLDGFAVGLGFSDQVFIASRQALGSPIYRQRCIARIAYPAAHKAHVFEARVDAHMRHHGCLRATSLSTTYATDTTGGGGSSYPPRGLGETARYVRNALTLRAFAVVPWRPRCLRRTWI